MSEHERRAVPSALFAVGAVLTVSLVAIFYLRHGYPGPGGRVWFGDSVSFQFYSVSRSLGHSPGYPQYLWLIRSLTKVPFGQAWQKVNFVSSLCSALALAAYCALCRQLSMPLWAAWLSALVLGLSKTFFCQATEAEVYALNSLWLFSCLALFARYLNTRTRRALWAFFVAYGLSLGHHPTMVLVVPAVVVTVLVHDRRVFLDYQAYLAAVLALCLGAIQYLYTYRLFVDRTLDYHWLAFQDGRTLSDFIDFSTGGPFKKALFRQPLGTLWRDKTAQLLKLAHEQNTFLLPLLGCYGLASLPRSLGARGLFIAVCLATYALWTLGYDVWDIEAFCTPIWALCYLGIVPAVRTLLRAGARVTTACVVTLTLLAFWYAVVDTDTYRPENARLKAVSEYLTKVPPGAKVIPFNTESNAALLMLFRYLHASSDSGPFELVLSPKHCVQDAYFAEASRKYLRTKQFAERRVGHLDVSNQDFFVMDCNTVKP